MERRELLTGGLLLGTSLVTEALGAPPPRPDHDFGDEDDRHGSSSLAFFEGTLQGSGFQGWPFSFSVSGKRALGFAYDPASVGGTLQALRFEGRVRGRQLLMQAFALADVNYLSSIGQLTGTGSPAGVQGSFTLAQGGGSGSFQAQSISLSATETRQLMGGYTSVAQNAAGQQFYTAALALLPGARWELRNIVAAAGLPALTGGAAHRLAGRYAVAEDGRLLLHLTRVPLRFRQPPAATTRTGATPAPPAPRPPAHPPAADRHPAARRTLRAAAAPVVFSDATFNAADWTSTKIADTTPAGEASFFAEQIGTGGNPGAFRRLTMDWFGFGEVLGVIIVANTGNRMTYDPRTNGAIGSVSFAFDMINLNTASQRGEGRYFPLLRQGDSYYSAGERAEPDPDAWHSFTYPNLTAQQFIRSLGSTGPDHPDFSATAPPLQFGYRAIGAGSIDPVTSVTGIDNFSVTVTPVELSRTITLSGSNTPPTGAASDYVAVVHNGNGQPVGGEQVLFTVLVNNAPAGSGTVTTAANGEAHFSFTFPVAASAQRFSVTATVDGNHNGTADPDEPAKTLEGTVQGLGLTLTGPTSAAPATQVCYTAKITGGNLAGKEVFLTGAPGSPVHAALGEGGTAQLCFTTPTTGEVGTTLTLGAFVDVNGSGMSDAGDLTSPAIFSLFVSGTTPPPDLVKCDDCCLGQLIISLQGGRTARVAVGDQIIIEHPFTHLIGIATRVR